MRRLKVVAIILAVGMLLVYGKIPASAQLIEAPPSSTNPPPGLAIAPPCADPALSPVPNQAQVPCGGLLAFTAGASAEDRANIVRAAGAVLRFNYTLVNGAAVVVPDENALAALLDDPNVVALIPDRISHVIAKGGQPGPPQPEPEPGEVVPSGVQRVRGDSTSTSTGAGVGVAIADTGLDLTHADLAPAAACFQHPDALSCQDDHGHGTHVGGIVAALDNMIDVVGVAPNATLYAVKICDAAGTCPESVVIAGLEWVASNSEEVVPPIRVVNMSIGRSGTRDDSPLYRAAIQNLTTPNLTTGFPGISVVVAAGNDPNKEVSQMVPATYPEVMAVASTTAVDGNNSCKFFAGSILADTASYFTTDGAFVPATGIGVTISAPGEKQENVSKGCFAKTVGILSLKLGGGTTRMSGTSMAAPHVAGVVALMWQQAEQAGVALAPEAARSAIRTTAARRNDAPLDSPTVGYSFDGEREGIVQAP